ncbi:uncharacterized protein SCHCODRAFT_02629298 [Schizophyllum commune H4-8]|uniref:Uncharacterized protein n=1 Tax=Schizophyllum commune (strain H4-8 / FGSC 9210) TaxID=578458 RepID=D8Q7G3_SCHCM|nr:uncharacterized protein SCHCODRAFT_02629298 [Schizophyllum commune H4-8]KAI5891506.1 hypothetical protein SCHCODRAFT_02629298 [Schizophyllum commune H4-8]
MSFSGLFSSTRSTASSSRGKVTFMSINVVPGQPESSFEELRVQDYLKAYTTTGKPPPPVPEQPPDAQTRATLGLPPLFRGVLIDESTGAIEAPPAPQEVYTDPAKLPPAQEFTVYEDTNERVKYQSICCHPSYQKFTPEELRYYAYLRGHKEPPTPVKMSPFGVVEASTTSSSSSTSTSRPPISGYNGTASTSSRDEQYQSINAKPEYEGHSFEELRYEFLKHGRELTSKEIFASYGANTAAAAPGFMSPGAAAPGAPAVPGLGSALGAPAIPGLAGAFGGAGAPGAFGAPAAPSPAGMPMSAVPSGGMFGAGAPFAAGATPPTFTAGAGAPPSALGAPSALAGPSALGGPPASSFAAGPPATPFSATPTAPATPFAATPTQPATPFGAQPGSAAPRRFW